MKQLQSICIQLRLTKHSSMHLVFFGCVCFSPIKIEKHLDEKLEIKVLAIHLLSDPVSVTVPLADMMVVETEGDMVTFTCTATGVPAPSFTWSPPDDGDRISVNTDPAVTDSDGFISVTSTLTISSLLRTDTGIYTCTASNTVMGSNMMMSRTFTLTVSCEYTICITSANLFHSSTYSYIDSSPLHHCASSESCGTPQFISTLPQLHC